MALQDKRYGTNLDLQGYQLKNHRLEVLSSDPVGSNAGDIWFNTTDGLAKIHDGANDLALYALDDDFYSLSTISSPADADFIMVAEASDSFNYKKITRANFLSGLGSVASAYYRIIAESGTANLDASGSDDIAISGDGSILQTVGSTVGNQELTIDWYNQTARLFLAGPTGGGSAQPTFRAILDADMPVSYNVTNWNSAYSHVGVVSGNPHAVSLSDVGGEAALGNPSTDDYILSSTIAGARSWINPLVLGGNDLSTLVITPGAGEDAYSVTWDNGNNRYTLTNIAGGGGTVTISGSPSADEIAIWASASSVLGDPNFVWNGTNFFVGLAADEHVALSDHDLALVTDTTHNNTFERVVYSANAAIRAYNYHARYGGSIASPAAAPSNSIIREDYHAVYDGTGLIDGGSIIVSVDGAIATGSFDTEIAMSVRSAAVVVTPLTIHPDYILLPNIDGTGTGTSMLYYNRATGEVSYADGPAAGTSYTFANGLDESGGTATLGGALTGDTDIDLSSYHFRVWSDSGYPNTQLLVDESGTSSFVTGYDANNYTGLYLPAGSAAEGYLIGAVGGVAATTYIGTGGMHYSADYGTAGKALGLRWIPDWGAVTTQLGGNDVTSLITGAGASEDGYAVTWNNGGSEYTLTTLGTYVERSEWNQNGFADFSDVDLSWDDASRTLTIQPAVTSFDYYLSGIKYTETGSITETVADTEGMWVFYLDAEGSIASVNSPSHSQIDGVIKDYAIIAYVYWDATNNDGRLQMELHGNRMSPVTHHWIHDNIGSVYKVGMALADFVPDDTGNVNTHAQFSIASGEFYDEDIEHTLASIASTIGLEIWYLDGSDWRWTTNAGYSILTAGTGRMAFNDSGSQTELTNNNFGLCHVLATNVVEDDGTTPKFIAVQGQAGYATIGAARAGAETEINSLVYGSFPLEEVIPVGTIIFQTSSAYSNAVKSRVRTTSSGDNFVDWRNSSLKASGGSISDHGSLAGLADDDHSQYALLAGRTGDVLNIDTITEFTTDAGVTIEDVLLLDNDIVLNSGLNAYILWQTGGTGFDTAIRGGHSTGDYFTISMDDVGTAMMFGSSGSYINQNTSYLDLIPNGNKTLNLGSASIPLWWDNVYADRYYIDDANTYLDINAGDLTFTDNNTGTKTLAELASGTTWAKNGTNLSPLTAGDDILLPANDRIQWATGGGYIIGGDTSISFYTNSDLRCTLGISDIKFYSLNIQGNSDKTTDLGTTSVFWDDAYIDTVYIDNVNTYIDVSGTDMTLTSADAGTVNLADILTQDSESVMHVERVQVLYSNTDQTTIITLPAGAVIWDAYVEVTTIFNGSGLDQINIGTTASVNRYDVVNVDSTGWITMSLTNTPDRMTGSTNITYAYYDQIDDASTGAAYIYIYYTLH